MSVGFTLIAAFVGWIWSMSGQAATVSNLVSRVTAIEAAGPAKVQWQQDVVSRLARIEGQLSEITHELHH